MIRSINKIYKTSEDAVLSSHSLNEPSANKGFPLVLQADGHACWPVIDYLLHRHNVLKKRISTVNTESSSLSLLIQYLNYEGISFDEMHNDSLISFRNYLIDIHKKGKASTINTHLRTSIRFLLWLDNQQRKLNPNRKRLISKSTPDSHVPAQIEIFIESVSIHKGRSVDSFRHECFLPESSKKKRHAIADETIDKLWSAIPCLCKTEHRRLRIELALLLSELLGNRVSELTSLTTNSCIQAIKSRKLTIYTAKNKTSSTRVLDIEDVLAKRLEQYILYSRKDVIESAIKVNKLVRDHGYLLINKDGGAWSHKSFQEEIRLLAKISGIKEPAHPHLFRHRKITQLAAHVKDLDYRKQLLILKNQGGWNSDKTPSHYIDLAQYEGEAIQNALKDTLNSAEAVALKRTINSNIEKILEISKDEIVTELASNIKDDLKNLFSKS